MRSTLTSEVCCACAVQSAAQRSVCATETAKKKKKKPGTSENKDKIKNNCRDAGEEISYHRLDFI